MPNCERNCGECARCVSAHAQIVIDEKEAENAQLRAELSALKSPDVGHWSTTALALKAAQAEIVALKETVSRLNRRCQDAESAARVKVEEVQKAGPSLGRALAGWAAGDYKRQLEDALLQNSELTKALTDLLDCLDVTGNWTESGDSVALWLTLKEDARLDELENQARQVLGGVALKPKEGA